MQIDPRFTQTLQRLPSQAQLFERFIRDHQHIGMPNISSTSLTLDIQQVRDM